MLSDYLISLSEPIWKKSLNIYQLFTLSLKFNMIFYRI